MGYDTMRASHSKLPNLAIASFVVSLFLAYNWWSLSTQNYELLRQMDDMGEQLKSCADDKSSCHTRRGALESQFRETEARMADMKMRELKAEEAAKRHRAEIVELNEAAAKTKRELDFCSTKLASLSKLDASKETVLAALKLEKETTAERLADAKGKVAQLEAEVRALRQTATTKATKLAAADGDGVLKSVSTASTKASEPLREPHPAPMDVGYPQINNDPVQDGNHEIFKEDSANDNVQLEDMDGAMEPLKLPQ